MFKTNLAQEVWEKKYRYGDETPIETWKRVANTLATVENKADQKQWAEKFLKTLVRFDVEGNPIGLKFTTGGRVTANIGTEYKAATLLNCYINGPVTGATIKYKRQAKDKKEVFIIARKPLSIKYESRF